MDELPPPPEPGTPLLRYIQQHRATYPRPAIDRRLLDAGYPPEQVNVVWQLVELGTPPSLDRPSAPAAPRIRIRAPRPADAGPFFYATVVSFVLFVYGIAGWLLLSGMTVGLAADRRHWAIHTDNCAGAGALWAGILVLGGWIGVRGREGGSAWARGLRVGAALAVAVLPLAAIAGACAFLVYLSTPTSP